MLIRSHHAGAVLHPATGGTVTLLPAIAVAATMVYWLSGFIGRHFSELTTQIIDLLLFVVIMTVLNRLLKSWRGD